MFYLLISPDDNAVLLAAALSISVCSFSSILLLSGIVMINVYVFQKLLCLKRKG